MTPVSAIWSRDCFEDLGLNAPMARVPNPAGPQDAATVFDEALKTRPDAIALVGRFRRLSFAELENETNAAAAYLQSQGIRTGDRIAASAANHPEIVIAFLAVERLGAIWVGINRNYSVPEKRYLLDDAQVSLMLAEPHIAGELADAAASRPLRFLTLDTTQDCDWSLGVGRHRGAARPEVEIDPWGPAAIAYTSGTTGRPKGAVHSQHNMLVAATIAALVAGDRRPEAIRGTASPLTILNMMIGGPLSALSTGNTHICMDRTDVAGLAEWIAREKINTLSLVPTLIQDLLTSKEVDAAQLASLTWIVVGAAMVPEGMPALYEARFGHKPTIGYGLTENPTVVSRTHGLTPAVQGAVGRPMAHLDVAILDEADNRLAPGSIGEIGIRAIAQGDWANVYTPTLGYWRRPEATAALLRNGWLHTGDVGMLDEAGELYIKARRSDLIVRGGSNIYPAEVERVLRLDRRVSDCAVLGKPDARLGESVAAFLQPLPGIDAGRLIVELRARCEQELARYKVPVFWKVLDELPRNTMGKIVKQELRVWFDAVE